MKLGKFVISQISQTLSPIILYSHKGQDLTIFEVTIEIPRINTTEFKIHTQTQPITAFKCEVSRKIGFIW